MLCFLFIIICPFANGQTDSVKKHSSPWLSISFQQELFPYKGPSYEYVTNIYGLKAGINVTTWFSKYLFINSGIMYSQRKQQYSRAIYSQLQSTSISSLEMVSFDGYKYNGVQIPLAIGFLPYQNKNLSIKIQVGLSANIKLREIYTGKTANGVYFETDNFLPPLTYGNPVHLFSPHNFSAGVGANYYLNNNFIVSCLASIDVPKHSRNTFSKHDIVANIEMTFSYRIKHHE